MNETLVLISTLGIILFIGLLCSIISRKLKIPNLLLLVGFGILLSHLTYNGEPLIDFSQQFLTAIAIITLAMVVFDSSSRLNFKRFDSLSETAIKLSVISLILNIFILSTVTYLVLNPSSVIIAIIFAVAVSGTDPSATLMVLSGARSKVFELLKVESITNTPLVVLIPFLLVDMIQTKQSAITAISSQILPFIQQFVAGIGTGVLVGLLFFRFMKKYYSKTLSPLAIIISSLLTYGGAEALGGNGVLAVTTLGLVFANLYRVKHRIRLQEFGEIFAEVFEILVFVLIGSVIALPRTPLFLVQSLVLFIAYLLIRWIAVSLTFLKSDFSYKEKLYMTLNVPKGIAVAVVVFSFATRSLQGISQISDLILVFLIYSIILSTFITRFTKFFTKVELKATEKE